MFFDKTRRQKNRYLNQLNLDGKYFDAPYFNRYEAKGEAKKNAKAVLGVPAVDLFLTGQHTLEAGFRYALALIDLCFLDINSTTTEGKDGAKANFKMALEETGLAIDFALSTLVDFLHTLFKLATHTIASHTSLHNNTDRALVISAPKGIGAM